MLTTADIRKARSLQKNLDDRSGLVGIVAHSKRPNKGRKLKPASVVEHFSQQTAQSEQLIQSAMKEMKGVGKKNKR